MKTIAVGVLLALAVCSVSARRLPRRPITISSITGGGLAIVGSGTAGSSGFGTTITSSRNGGFAQVVGRQSSFVRGFGPSSGETSLQGSSTVIDAGKNRRSTFVGTSTTRFRTTGGGRGSVTTDSFVSGFSTPTSSTGVSTASGRLVTKGGGSLSVSSGVSVSSGRPRKG